MLASFSGLRKIPRNFGARAIGRAGGAPADEEQRKYAGV